jgi:chromosome segregation ATPase
MNERKKGIFIFIVVFLSALYVFLSVRNYQSVRRADTTIDNLERELAAARAGVERSTRELEDSRRTIKECHDTVGRIADSLGEQSGELQSIIGNLKTVRQEIENMESTLNFFYIKYGLDDNTTDNNLEELK